MTTIIKTAAIALTAVTFAVTMLAGSASAQGGHFGNQAIQGGGLVGRNNATTITNSGNATGHFSSRYRTCRFGCWAPRW